MRVWGVVLAAMLLVQAAQAQPQPPDTLWTYQYLGAQDDVGTDLVATADGSLVFLIESEAQTVDSGRAALAKLGPDGQLHWQRAYRRQRLSLATCLAQTADGGFVLGGAGRGTQELQALLKVDSVGNVRWYHTWNIWRADWPVSLITTHDGGLAALTAGMQLMRFNAQGDTLWTRAFRIMNYFSYGGELAETQDGGFLLCAWREFRRPDSSLSVQPWVGRTDAAGDLVWERRLDTRGRLFVSTLAPTADDGCVIAGLYNPPDGEGATGPYTARLSAAGDTLWTRYWEDVPGSIRRCRPAGNGCFALGGILRDAANPGAGYYLALVDGDGRRLWSRGYGNASSASAWALAVLPDGSFGLAGDQWNGAGTGQDAWLARLTVPATLEELRVIPQRHLLELTVSPNPFNSATTLRFALPAAAEVRLTLFDVTGRVVLERELGRLAAGEHVQALDAEGLASGVYFVRVQAGDMGAVGKVMLLK